MRPLITGRRYRFGAAGRLAIALRLRLRNRNFQKNADCNRFESFVIVFLAIWSFVIVLEEL